MSDMILWAIYDSPTDFPIGTVVARKWKLEKPTDEFITGKTLDDVRDKLPDGLYRIPRFGADDPKIVEVWV